MTPSGTVEPGSNSPPEPTTPSLAALLIPLVQNWKVVLALPFAAGLVTGLVSSVVRPAYTATTTFTAEVSSGSVLPASLADVAGRFGLPSGRTGTSQPDFFAEVLTSQEILIAMLQTHFVDDRSSPSTSRELMDIMRIEGATPAERLDRGVRKLRSLVRASFSTRTTIVTLNVEASSPGLAAAMANRVVQLLDSFNIVRRQYQSRELRRFAGERLAEAQAELNAAESLSLRFLQLNRRLADSPLLLFQAKRLEREVDLRQDVVITLTREYEQARIAEHRDVPLLSVIDPARPPHKKSSPRRVLNTLIAMFMSGVLTILLVYAREIWIRQADDDRASHESLARARDAVLVGIKRVLRRGPRVG